MLKLRHEFAVEAAKSLSCEEPTSLLCKHVIHPATGQGQCQADEVIFTSVLWGVSCNIFDVWVFSALQHSLGEDGGHSVLARVVPLQQHVLELRVHILNLLVHLLENQGYWQHAITSYLIYTIVLIVHYLRWRGCVHPGCSSWCASRSSRSRARPPRCRSRSAAGLPRSSTWKQTLPKAQQTQGLSAFTKVTAIGSDWNFRYTNLDLDAWNVASFYNTKHVLYFGFGFLWKWL